MSNVIKSFRVIERDSVIRDDDQIDNANDIEISIERSILINEAKAEAATIVKISEERSKQILREAEKQRIAIIRDAEDQSYNMKEEASNTGYNEGYDFGHKEGFKKGYDEGKLVSDGLIQESLKIKDDYIDTRNNLLVELEKDIIGLVISVYEKILDKEVSENDDTITSLVLSGIKNLDPTEKLIIIVSKEDYNSLEESRDEILAKASLINQLDIKYDINLSKGDCILETGKGSIDISIKDQIDEVRELLTTILNNE